MHSSEPTPDLETTDLQKQQEDLQVDINKLSIEAENLQPGEPIPNEKKEGITKTLEDIAYKLIDISPTIAETIAGMTPLAPFSKSIGKGMTYFKELINKKINRTV